MSILIESYRQARNDEFHFAKVCLKNISKELGKLCKQIHDNGDLPENNRLAPQPIEKESFDLLLAIDGKPTKLLSLEAEKKGGISLKIYNMFDETRFSSESYAAKKDGTSPDLERVIGEAIDGFVRQTVDLSRQEPVIGQTSTPQKKHALG